MLKYVQDLESYIRNNAGSIVNYGQRYRHGERISTGFAESTINQVMCYAPLRDQQAHGQAAADAMDATGRTYCYKCGRR